MTAKSLVERVHACARAHRCGETMTASEQLVAIVDELALRLANESDPERRQRLADVAESVMSAQKRGDVIGIADALEYELIGLMEAAPTTER